MYKKLYLVPIILSLILFSACSNRVVNKEAQAKKENQTIKESSLIGKVLIGTLTFLGTGNLQKTFQATKFGGNASGYFVGKKLSDMQKKYKDKEEVLISKILQIDEEASVLETKNLALNKDLIVLQKNLTILENNKSLKEAEKNSQKLLIKAQLKKEKEKLNKLLNENNKLSQKISFSKDKTNEYNYSKEDKKELLSNVNFLEKSMLNFKTKINEKLTTINNLIETL